MIKNILQYNIRVELDQPANGFWDGGAKSSFTFTPSIERTPGPAAIRWGSWEANMWFVVNFKGNIAKHLAAVKRKLRGKPSRRITLVKLA